MKKNNKFMYFIANAKFIKICIYIFNFSSELKISKIFFASIKFSF